VTRDFESVLANPDASVRKGDNGDRMTNAELADSLNERFALAGPDAVTLDVVRQWVAWDVLPRAQAKGRLPGKGPIWNRDEHSLRRAYRLTELRKAGVRRENAVIVQAYVEWGHPDFDRVRGALRAEFSKWRNQLNRDHTTFIGDDGYRGLSASRKRSIANQLGPLDGRFVGTQFEQSPEVYAVLANLARLAAGDLNQTKQLISKALEQLHPNFRAIIPIEITDLIANSISGLTGIPDEIEQSGEEAIEGATERQFRIARYHVRLILMMLRKASTVSSIADLDFYSKAILNTLSSISQQISVGGWVSTTFAQALLVVCRQSEFQSNAIS